MTQSTPRPTVSRAPGALDLPTFRPRPPQTPPQEVEVRAAVPAPSAPEVNPLAQVPIGRSPLPPRGTPTHLPNLPKGRRPSFSRHRNDANAARAVELLAHVDSTVVQWHEGLRQVLEEIQAVYVAGPIVEGWLEAATTAATAAPTPHDAPLPQHASLLRHGDPAHLARYVDNLTAGSAPPVPSAATQYRLCSLDADGRLQCQPCPPEQLGAISQGIARHQQLRALVQRKQDLEAKLQKATMALSLVCDQLGLVTDSTERG